MSASRTTLSAAADERKARLSKFRSLKRKQPDEEDPPPESGDVSAPRETETAKLPLHLSGRNYDPETKGPKLGFEAPPVGEDEVTLEKQAEEIEAEVRRTAEEEAKDDKGIDLFKLQPKKPNWDLKRELNKKLEILNVRTDNAIARLVRERLAAKKGGPQAVSASTAEDAGGALEGAALVEGIRLREQEEREEERRERELDDMAGQ